MPLVQMALGRYRCFAKSQDIELRPITVILGRNNSGKSALVRAPVILDTGLRTDSPAPLDLDMVDEELVGSFTDLVHGSRTISAAIVAGLRFDSRLGPLNLFCRVQHFHEYRTEAVGGIDVFQAGMRLLHMELESGDPRQTLLYTVGVGGQTWTGIPVEFQGLLPARFPGRGPDLDSLPADVVTHILGVAHTIREHHPRIRYIGPFRERPQRRYRLPARMPPDVGKAGEEAARIIASDAATNHDRLITQINSDLAAHPDLLPGWRLSVEERGDMWAVLLTSEANKTMTVNIVDTGTGVAQVLPIFVQRAVDAVVSPTQPVLEIVEQPELHLHPAAHAALADLYLAAIHRTSTRFLIETHSETFLLRLRRRIAEGLDPQKVAVHFVEQVEGVATIRRIDIDEDGNVDYWPRGIFTEDYEETQELARAQWRRQDTHAR